MTRTIWLIAALLLAGTGQTFLFPANSAQAQDDWKAEFDDICSRTTDAMTLSPNEIKGLIARCEKLRPRIEKLDETAAKVYLKRLEMCKDLFVFVLENPGK
jgi:hypothetical protein